MSQLAAVLLLVACPADLTECREASAPQPVYESIAACQSDKSAQPNVSTDGKQLLGTCITIDASMLIEDAEIVWDVTADRQLSAEVRLIDDIDAAEKS